jgi:hypothetical protein
MIVKDLLLKIDFEKTWNYMVDFYFQNCDEEKRPNLKEKIKGTIEELKGIEPIIDKNWILIFDDHVYDDLETDGDVFYFDSYLFDKSEVFKNFKEDEVVENNINISDWSYEEIKEYVKKRAFFVSYGYEFSDWAEVLGFDVDEESIEEYGTNKCASEILYEMTYSGFSQKECKERISQIFDDEDEIKADIAEDDMEDIDDEPDFYVQKTEEEQKEELRKTIIVSQKNWINIYNKIKLLKSLEDIKNNKEE